MVGGNHSRFEKEQTVTRIREEDRQSILKIASFVGGGLMIVVIVWIDVATGIWQNLVILSGLAAGFVSFFLTTLVLRSLVARATAKRWAPVNRIAIVEFLHAIADDERSEIAHGVIVPRRLPAAVGRQGSPELAAELRALRETVAAERSALSEALSRWAEFLTTTGDNEEVLQHVARIAFQLDRVRDAAIELEAHPSDAAELALGAEIADCNEHFALLVDELQARLEADNALELGRRRREAAGAA